MLTAVHTLIYSSDPPATRAFFRDVLQWPFVSDADSSDAGADPGDATSWLIFGTGPSELGVHPLMPSHGAGAPQHVMSLVCDDVEATARELTERGAHLRGVPEDRGYGIAIDVEVPGTNDIQVYEPRHTVAYQLPAKS
ncbi:VOC family protein [Flexivirga sp. B27]